MTQKRIRDKTLFIGPPGTMSEEQLFEAYQYLFSSWKMKAAIAPNNPQTKQLEMMAKNVLKEAEQEGYDWAKDNTDFQDNVMYQRMQEYGEDWDRPYEGMYTDQIKRKIRQISKVLTDPSVTVSDKERGDMLYQRERLAKELMTRGETHY